MDGEVFTGAEADNTIQEEITPETIFPVAGRAS